MAVSLPGLAALGALLFTWLQGGQASKELRINESGQITNRFNAAIGNLGSASLDVRLGGIYALQRIMQDSARDHPTVVSVLAAFVRQHAGSSAESKKGPTRMTAPAGYHAPPVDVRAAYAVLARRQPDRDSGTSVDLSKTDLRGLRVTERIRIRFPGADLTEADLRYADLTGADLQRANLVGSNVEKAILDKADLTGADLGQATLRASSFDGADLRKADVSCEGFSVEPGGKETLAGCTNLEYAHLNNANLRGANLTGVDLRWAVLTGADLRDANLTDADLRNTDLTGAKMAGAKMLRTKTASARGLPKRS
ncbi:pentapeptide repeat-containing protein [Streptomyces ficellus]|uniref:pentapeptide repeat-containing protein n=1 Tax=Streptomyces ficellus TaxID=1977088 RepID=UPI00142E9FF8|nr:pentapeptide repeat-containing protein [Streptomyces ficellus]